MYGRNELSRITMSPLRGSRKASVFSASAALFLTVLLVFAVAIFKSQDKLEERVLSNSLVTQTFGLERSISYSIRDIFKSSRQISFSEENLDNSQVLLSATAGFTEKGYQKIASFDTHIDDLSDLVDTLYPWLDFDEDVQKADALLFRGDGIALYKRLVAPSESNNETLFVYYNFSDKSTSGRILGIDILINSFENMRIIEETTTYTDRTPQDIAFNISFNDLDYNPAGGVFQDEEPDANFTIYFRPSDISEHYSFVVKNASHEFFRISLMRDGFNITSVARLGSYNVTAGILTHRSNTYPHYRFRETTMHTSIPGYGFERKGYVYFD